jgi:hypothetical protein
MAVAVARSVHDAEIADPVSVMQSHDLATSPILQEQLPHPKGKAVSRRSLPDHDVGVGVVAGNWHAQGGAEGRRRAPVIRMSVGQRQHRHPVPPNLALDPTSGPARAAVEEDVVDQEGVDGVGGKGVELPDAVGYGSQSQRSLREPPITQ